MARCTTPIGWARAAAAPPARSQARASDARRASLRPRRAGATALLAAVLVLAVVLRASSGSSKHRRAARTGSSASAIGAHETSRKSAAARVSANSKTAEIARLVALGKPIYCAGTRGKEVALTFDDGPGVYTHLILAKLRKHGVRATFFIVGCNIPLLPGATRAERAIGAVGDHTFTHPLLTSLAPSEAEAQIARTQTDLARSSGGSVFLFRPPYGAHDASIDGIARARALLEILWTIDSADSLSANYARIEHNVIAGMHPGSIILMHENRGQTIRAMIAIFAALQRKHLRAVSVSELLNDDPPSLAQVHAGGHGCGVPAAGAVDSG